ncbi:expressed protein, partial [Phakopsora pachyrhizi]
MYSKMIMFYLFYIAIATLDFSGALTTYGGNDKYLHKRDNETIIPEGPFKNARKEDCPKYQQKCQETSIEKKKCPDYCAE